MPVVLFGVFLPQILYAILSFAPPFSPAISKVTGTLPGAEVVLSTMSPKGSITKAPASHKVCDKIPPT